MVKPNYINIKMKSQTEDKQTIETKSLENN